LAINGVALSEGHRHRQSTFCVYFSSTLVITALISSTPLSSSQTLFTNCQSIILLCDVVLSCMTREQRSIVYPESFHRIGFVNFDL